MAAQPTVVPFRPRRSRATGRDPVAAPATAYDRSPGAPARPGRSEGADRTLVLRGALDHATAIGLEIAIERACELNPGPLTLDLRELASIDWAGVMVISFRCRLCLQRGHELTLIAGPPQVQDVFAHAGLLGELPFVEFTREC